MGQVKRNDDVYEEMKNLGVSPRYMAMYHQAIEGLKQEVKQGDVLPPLASDHNLVKERDKDEYKLTSFFESVFIPIMMRKMKVDPFCFHDEHYARMMVVFGSGYVNRSLPHYDWNVWEGRFTDKDGDKEVAYTHAWMYGIHQQNRNKQLFVDFGRIGQPTLIRFQERNAYDTEAPAYVHTKLLKKPKQMNLSSYKTLREKRTGETYRHFLKDLEETMKRRLRR